MQLSLANLASLFALCLAVNAQTTECAQIRTFGHDAVLVADSSRPVDSIANAFSSRYGIQVNAEEPQYLFAADMEDVRLADTVWSASHPEAHYFVPKRHRLEIHFPTFPRLLDDGRPSDISRLLQQVLEAANKELPFQYRLDVDGEFSTFVPTATKDKSGREIEATALLDRRVSIAAGTRSLAETGRLMADALSAQIGLHVNCCQAFIGGIPWGQAVMPFEAHDEPARKVLERLIRLDPNAQHRMYWLVRCDSGSCFIDLNPAWGGECGGPMMPNSPWGTSRAK